MESEEYTRVVRSATQAASLCQLLHPGGLVNPDASGYTVAYMICYIQSLLQTAIPVVWEVRRATSEEDVLPRQKHFTHGRVLTDLQLQNVLSSSI